jgi:hypothetical protein
MLSALPCMCARHLAKITPFTFSRQIQFETFPASRLAEYSDILKKNPHITVAGK